MRLFAVAVTVAAAVVAWFLVEVWRIGRGLDVTPTPEPDDEELDRLAYAVPVGMPTWRPYSLLD